MRPHQSKACSSDGPLDRHAHWKDGMSDAQREQPFTVDSERRQVRSFVLRQGRITPSQERAMRELWPRYGVDYTAAPRALHTLFGRTAPCVMEIGFGNGTR